MSKKSSLVLMLIAALLALTGTGVAVFKGLGNAEKYARAEFSVKNLTCGSCVRNIQKVLDGLSGVGKVDVSVTLGQATVEYDPSRVSAEKIAQAVSHGGYPATLIRSLTAVEYRNLKTDETRLAAKYVARIGDHLLSRDEFEKELSRQTKNQEGSTPSPGLLRSAWKELHQQELLLLSAERNGVVVSDAEVDLEIQKMQKGMKDFDALIASRFGGREAFSRRLRTEMIINRNIEEHVLPGLKDGAFRRQKLENWFRELSASTPITIFDPTLKAAVESGSSGCGGSCCG